MNWLFDSEKQENWVDVKDLLNDVANGILIKKDHTSFLPC